MNTKCEKCIFKLSSNGYQTGCKFDIPKTITQEYAAIYDKSKTIKVLDSGDWKLMNFKCPVAITTQTKEYLIQNGVDEKDIETTVLSLTKNVFYLIYFVNDDLDMLRYNLDKITNHFCQPSFISFVKQSSAYTAKSLMSLLDEYKLSSWKLHDIVDNDIKDNEIIDMVMDTNLGNNKTQSLAVWYNNCTMPNDYFDKVNETMNYFLGKQAYVVPIMSNGFNGLFIPFSAYLSNHKKINLTMQSLDEDITNYKLCVL